jgi:hypothetical protein
MGRKNHRELRGYCLNPFQNIQQSAAAVDVSRAVKGQQSVRLGRMAGPVARIAVAKTKIFENGGRLRLLLVRQKRVDHGIAHEMHLGGRNAFVRKIAQPAFFGDKEQVGKLVRKDAVASAVIASAGAPSMR